MIDILIAFETAHLRKTMVHEMCHVWCSIHYQDISHLYYLAKNECLRLSIGASSRRC